MQDTIVTIYCLCDDVLRALEHQDDPQTKVSSAEVMTVPLVAASFYGGKIEWARRFLIEHGYLSCPLSQSRLNRRLHALPLWVLGVADAAGRAGHGVQKAQPRRPLRHRLAAGSGVRQSAQRAPRIRRCKRFQGEEHRGYTASKRRYFFGLKVHLVVTGSGCPIEFVLTPGSSADVTALKELELDLPAGAILHGDRAYTDYQEEDLLQEAGQVTRGR